MNPPSPPAQIRRSSTSSNKHTFADDVEQSGRTASSLHAHNASALYTQPTSTSLDRPRENTGPNEAQLTSHTPSSLVAVSDVTSSKRPSATVQQAQSPSVLSNDSSNSATSSRDGQGRANSDDTRRSANAAAIGAAIAETQGLAHPPRIPMSRSDMSSRGSSTSLARMQTPRTVRDLGSDYTRYFNPFATRNNSQTEITTPLPRYNSATGQPLPTVHSMSHEKRDSNPFSDEKSVPAAATATTVAVAASEKYPMADPMLKPKNGMIDNMDPEKSFFPYLDDRFGAPGAEGQYNFPLYWDEVEGDDDMHLPMVDDDKNFRPSWKQRFTRDNIVSTLGMAFMILGLLCVFVVLPVVSSTGVTLIDYTYGSDSKGGSTNQATWATVNNKTYSLMKNVRTGLIDPDTPESAYNMTALDGTPMRLVFSDEFNTNNRTFYPGDDPFFFGFDGWYGATMDLEWYDPDAITTFDGTLNIQMDDFATHGLQYRSGMLNSWNQLCFKGGVFEVSVSLPEPAGVHALWPGVWTMGNLGRPGYLATTDGTWPYTYNECDVGISPNQSSPDGISKLPGQKLSSCTCPGADHPSPGTGRGAPEIDVIEVAGSYGDMQVATATQSFQVAPFDIFWYPNYEFFETPDYSMSFVNTYTGGPYQQAVSTTTMLNNDWYDGKEYQRYSFEYQPGGNESSYLAWKIADTVAAKFDARAIGPNGNIGQRLISEEPMSIIMNLGISENWCAINYTALTFPTIMRFDYVRWYQKEGQESVTCDPPGYETTEYIANHPEAYNNPNYTHWTDIPGYSWPKNSLMHGCS